MSPVEFIAAIAWPVAILVIAIIYRAPLGRLVGGERTKLKAGPFELAWESARPNLPRPALAAVDSDARLSASGGRLASTLVDQARESPGEAVLAAYSQLGEAFTRGLKELGIGIDAEQNDPLALAREAERKGVIGPEITHAIEGLDILRNLAARRPSQALSEGRAFEYLAMADAVLYAIAGALSKHTAQDAGEAPSSRRLAS